jgi:hypothetical protein
MFKSSEMLRFVTKKHFLGGTKAIGCHFIAISNQVKETSVFSQLL